MENITVLKSNLLDALRVNKDEHMALYDQAVIAFRLRLGEELDRRLAQLRNGDKVDMYIRIPVPEQHEEDFDRAIQMLEWEVGEQVELSEHDFACFVQNQWGWVQSFTANTVGYTRG